MSGRTPSFIVVGLVIIMFLLGLFYMSCSSKNTELRLSLEQFEERLRSLTLKNSDSEKKYDNLNVRKRELEEEKANIQRQMEKKDSEINDLNTKLNEKIAEVKSLQSDRKVFDEQLKDYKSLSETVASKNSLIEKLQQQINDLKSNNNDELGRLRREYDALKSNASSLNVEPKSTFVISPQRFRPIDSNNFGTRSTSSIAQDPLNRLNNLTKEVKQEPIAPPPDAQENVLNVNTNLSTSTINNQQVNINNDKNQLEVGQNVPPPPLANNAQQQQQAGHVESAQAAPKVVETNQGAADNQYQNKLQNSLNNSLSDNDNAKLGELNEHDDEADLNFDNEQQNENAPRRNNVEGDNALVDAPAVIKSKRKAFRTHDREQFRLNRDHLRQQKLDNGEELDVNEDNDQFRQVQKKSVL